MQITNEKRRSRRMDIDVNIQLDKIKNKKDISNLRTDKIQVELVNVSMDGIAFRTAEELKLNTFYDAEVVLWSKEVFHNVIEIIRMENAGETKTLYGCRFIGIKPNDQLLIKIHELFEDSNKK